MNESFQALAHLIHTRRTTKVFDGAPVSKQTVQSLLELAIWAPNHRLNQPWRFRVIRDGGIFRWVESFKARLPFEEFNLFQKNFERLVQVGAVIYVTHIKDSNEIIDFENHAATCAGVQNILLGATALGLQTYWNTGRTMTHPVTLEFLGVEPNERIVGAIWVGQGELSPPKARSDVDSKTIWFE